MEIEITQKGTRVWVLADIISPKLENAIIPINFLADTGADTTTISPRDASTNKIDFSKLEKKKIPSVGIGGVQSCVYEIKDVEFRFRNINGNPIIGKLDVIDIMEPNPREETTLPYTFKIPSLLGTDMLQYLKFTYNSHAKLELKK